MTGIRQSFVFCRERDGFGTGKAESYSGDYNFIHVDSNVFIPLKNQTSKDYWIAPPPGSYFSHTSSRSVKRIQTTGSKFWDAMAYGRLSGTWEWTFVLDPEYMEPLLFAFEESVISNSDVANDDGTTYHGVLTNNRDLRNYYMLKKANNVRVPSFTVKIAIDDKSIKGGAYNESKILKGCVVKDVKFTKGSDSSVIEVSMSGFYADESLTYESANPITVYKAPVNNNQFEWAAAYIRRTGSAYIDYSANVSSISLTVGNSAQGVYSTATPIAQNFSEGQTSISLSLTSYYTDPRQYRTMLSTAFGTPETYYPSSKGMKPLDNVYLVSGSDKPASAGRANSPGYKGVYARTADMYPTVSTARGKNVQVLGDIMSTNDRRYAIFDLEGVAVKSLVWEKGDGGSPLQDRIDGNDCRTIRLNLMDYPSDFVTYGMFHKILVTDPAITFNGTLITRSNGAGQSKTDWPVIAGSAGALASATKIYNVNEIGGGPTVASRMCQRLDGWFAPYRYDNIPVNVYGYKWEETGITDSEGNPVYGWVWHDVTDEYVNPTASGWLYSSHFAEPFSAPAQVSMSMGPLSMGTLNAPSGAGNGDESLINTDEENNEI
jgi:hypothetical protein